MTHHSFTEEKQCPKNKKKKNLKNQVSLASEMWQERSAFVYKVLHEQYFHMDEQLITHYI